MMPIIFANVKKSLFCKSINEIEAYNVCRRKILTIIYKLHLNVFNGST